MKKCDDGTVRVRFTNPAFGLLPNVGNVEASKSPVTTVFSIPRKARLTGMLPR